MPQLANITVKDDANADVVYIARSAASGDGQYAQWSTAGPTPLASATLRAKAVSNGKGNGRRLEINGQIPYVLTVDGQPNVVAMQPFSVSVIVPSNQPVATSVRNATVIGNLMASALIKEIIGSTYSAT